MAESKVAALEGNELTDNYVRTHIPQGRWGDTWDLFKSNFVKFVIINVFVLFWCVPSIILFYFRGNIISQLGAWFPFSSNPLFLYPLTPPMQGTPERIVLLADLIFYSILIVGGLIAAIGVSGACYSIKKLINTHGQFTFKDLFRGIKVCYFNVLLPTVLFLLFLFASVSISDWAAWQIALGAGKGGPITAKVFIIIATVIIGVIAMWLLAVGVSYKVKFVPLIKNSIVLLIGSIIQTLFMVGFSLIPVWILLIGVAVTFVKILGYIIFIFFGFSFILLCWLSFTQWVFDMYITPVVKKEEEVRKANRTPQQIAAEKEEEEKAAARALLAAGRSELVGRPMRPIEGGTVVKEVGVAYGRADISRVSGDRRQIEGEVDAYYEEHKNDTRYVEYEKMFAERERALNTDGDGKKKKKKKISKNNLLGN